MAGAAKNRLLRSDDSSQSEQDAARGFIFGFQMS